MKTETHDISDFSQLDLEYLETAHKKLDVYLNDLLPKDEKCKDLETQHNVFQYTLNDSKFVWLYTKCKIMFAFLKGKRIGYLAYQEKEILTHSLIPKTAYVYELFVNEDQRGKHVGKKLLDALKLKYDRVRIMCVMKANDKALNFYKKAGFEVDIDLDDKVGMRFENNNLQK